MKLFDAVCSPIVLEGYCIIYNRLGEHVYTGPLKTAPDPVGEMIVYLNPIDFAELKNITLTGEDNGKR